MNRLVFATAALSALLLQVAPAQAACKDSPKVTSAKKPNQAKLLEACTTAGVKMHNLCDNVSACTVNDSKEDLKGKVSKAQKCIDARRQITKEWYAGNGDAGHDLAIEGKVNQANKCILQVSKK